MHIAVFSCCPQAFAALATAYGLNSPAGFLTPAYKPILARLISYHVIPGKALKAADLKNGQVLTTSLPGNTLTIKK